MKVKENLDKQMNEAMEELGDELQLQVDLTKKIKKIVDGLDTYSLRFLYSFLSTLYGVTVDE